MREFWNDLTEQFRRLRVMSLCFAVILLLLGIFLVIRPGAAIRFICFLIGLCLLAYGVFLTVNYFAELRNTNVLNPLPYRIILGVILLVIGLLIILHPEGIISFDTFVKVATFQVTWIGAFSIWDNDCDNIEEFIFKESVSTMNK